MANKGNSDIFSEMNTNLLLSSWGRQLGKKLMKINKKTKPYDCHKWNIVRGDFVRVIQGPQSGHDGKVLHVLRKQNRVIVEGVNMRRRSTKPQVDGTPGRIEVKPCAIHYSNVMLIDPSIGEPTKVMRRYLEDGTKVRVSKKTGEIIPKPHPLFDRKSRTEVLGPKDTLPKDVFSVTFADYEKYLPFIYATKKSL